MTVTDSLQDRDWEPEVIHAGRGWRQAQSLRGRGCNTGRGRRDRRGQLDAAASKQGDGSCEWNDLSVGTLTNIVHRAAV
eukprot:763875-Hanusia_phi.AAC.4